MESFAKTYFLTLFWVGFLGVRFELGVAGGQITPCLKFVRLMLET